ncbi:hypothetical protein [Yoonia sp. 2307UL14-13]|uniref:hypothetical protein n=1 Tax=Yoonia sp. 2307UL14-13 TaxID=3126506 RepID=UPI00309E35BA
MPNVASLIGGVIGGLVPILVISWILRRLFRSTSFSGVIISVVLAAIIAMGLYILGNANGDFSTARALQSLRYGELIYGPAAVVAVFVIITFRAVSTSKDEERQ